MKQKAINIIASPLLQLSFVAAAATVYLLQAANLYIISAGLYGNLMQATYSDGWRLSEFSVVVLESLMLPPLLFVIALAFLKRQTWLPKLFQASLLTLMALLFQGILVHIQTAIFEVVRTPITDSTFYWIQAAEVGLVLTAFTVFLIRRLRRSKMTSQLAAPIMKKSLVGLAVVNVLAAAAVIVYRIIGQYPTNPNLSGFLTISLITVVIPGLLFGLCYWLYRGGADRLERSFIATVFAILGLLLYLLISQAVRFINPEIYQLFEGYWPAVTFNLCLLLAGAVLSVGLLAYLRKPVRS